MTVPLARTARASSRPSAPPTRHGIVDARRQAGKTGPSALPLRVRILASEALCYAWATILAELLIAWIVAKCDAGASVTSP